MNRPKLLLAALLITYIPFNYLTMPDCAAQTPRAVSGNDMVSYKITPYENDKEYITYCQMIRERIKERLKNKYTGYFKEGDVDLYFLVRSDGRLLRFDIDPKNSTDDGRLIDITVLSLKKSSPFPPFPKGLDADELPFFVTISFKEKGDIHGF